MPLFKQNILTYFVKGQLWLFASAFLCMFLLPDAIQTNDGISYYGVHIETVLPFTLGLLATAWYSFNIVRTSKGLLSREVRFLTAAVGALLVGLVVTPHTLNTFFWAMHVMLGVLLFFTQYILMTWLMVTMRRDTTGVLLVVLTGAVTLFTGYYLSSAVGYLIFGQLLFQALFVIVWWRSVNPAARSAYPTSVSAR